jgi:hypothetical protein
MATATPLNGADGFNRPSRSVILSPRGERSLSSAGLGAICSWATEWGLDAL